VYAIASLLFVIAVSLLITRAAVVVLVATGMPRQQARFQARSAFTGSGFTTNESEAVLNHPVRRKVAMTLMLLGNAGIVASASTLIIGFRKSGVGHGWMKVIELVAGLVVLLYLTRSAVVDRALTGLAKRLVRRYTDVATNDADSLLDLGGDSVVSELMVRDGDWLAGRTLAELGLYDEGVLVLGRHRPGGDYFGSPSGSTRLDAGDSVILSGRAGALRELDERPAGAAGDRRHAAESSEMREVSDARTFRALTHPTRLALIETLSLEGPLTATEAGEKVGESPSNCSFHLRQLAKYGFVEEAGGGKGRSRPWRMTSIGMRSSNVHDDPETALAAGAFNRLLRERQLERYRTWLETRASYPTEWQEAAGDSEYVLWLTAQELEDLGDESPSGVPSFGWRPAGIKRRGRLLRGGPALVCARRPRRRAVAGDRARRLWHPPHGVSRCRRSRQ
jgi:DNA-binding transcriptional ArsR family regulator